MSSERVAARRRRAVRVIASWAPAALVVPAVLAGAVLGSRTEPANSALASLQPLEPGTTWVYSVSDHGDPSGIRVRQVLGPSQQLVDGTPTEMVRISSRYDDYPGRGPVEDVLYVSDAGDALLQHSIVLDSQTLDIAPAAPAYQLPATAGSSFDYDGSVGGIDYRSETELVEVGPLEVGGRTLEGCRRFRVVAVFAGMAPGQEQVTEEWNCPGIGMVRQRTVDQVEGLDVTEELTDFRSPDRAVDLEVPEASPDAAPTDEEDPAVEVRGLGMDPGRSNAVPGEISGTSVWSVTRDQQSSQPVVSAGTLEVVVETDGSVTARDTETGAVRWRVALPPPLIGAPAITDDVVMVADGDKRLWAFALDDGRTRWVHTFRDVVSASPAVAETSVVVPVDDGTVVALSTDDGTVRWTRPLDGLVRTPPAYAEGTVVVADDSGAMVGLDTDDGQERWRVDLVDGISYGPVVSRNRVVAVEASGATNAVDLSDGSFAWQRRSAASPVAAPALAEDRVIIATEGGGLDALDSTDGGRIWTRSVGEIDESPVVVGDEVVAVDERGRVSVLALEDGERVDTWQVPSPRGLRIDLVAPVGMVGGALTARFEVQGDTFGYLEVAYAVDGRDLASPGVTYDAAGTLVPLPIATPPAIEGDRVYGQAFEGTTFAGPLGGSATPLLPGSGSPVGLSVGDGVVVSARGEKVWGVDAVTGNKLWSLPTGAAVPGTVPVASGSTAFVPIYGQGLVAVDLRDGTPDWTVPLPGSQGSSGPLPLPGGDVLYAQGGLARYDGGSGEVVWRLAAPLTDANSFADLAVDDDAVHAILVLVDAEGNESPFLTSADLRTGEIRWAVPWTTHQLGLGLATDGDVVIAPAEGGSLVAVSAADGTELWRFTARTPLAGVPTVRDGRVTFVEKGFPDDLLQRETRLVTLDAATGAFLGSWEPPSSNSVILPNVGVGPDGELLVPNTSSNGQQITVIEISERGQR